MLQDIKSAFHNREMMRRIFSLAWPTVMEQAMQTIVQYADTAQVGVIGANASAAVGLTATMNWLINAPFFAAGMGVLSCISRSLGAKEEETARKAAVQSILLCLILGFGLGILTLCLTPFLPDWLGAAPEIRRDAGIYFGIICLPMVFRASGIIFGSVLRAVGNSKTPMLCNIVMNILNILLNFLLINPVRTTRIGPLTVTIWGAGWGVAGAAIATAIAYVVGGTLMFLGLWHNPILAVRRQRVRLDRPVMRQCVWVGLPIAGERVITCLGQVLFTALIARLGTVAIAAHSIAITAEQAFYIPGYGMQAAAATLSGHAAGEGNEKKLMQYSSAITVIAVGLMSALSVLLFFFPHVMMSIFTRDMQVIQLGAQILRIVAVSEPFFAVVIILEGVFNGVGDTKVPFVIAASTMWGVRILFTFLCVAWLHTGLQAVWICMVADNFVRFVCLSLRYGTGKWKARFFPAS